MRTKLTATLLILNVLVFCYIYWTGDTTNQSGDKGNNAIGTMVREIDRIRIEAKTEKSARQLLKVGTEWKVEEPIEWPANLFAIQRIITQVQFMDPEVSFSVNEIEASGQSLDDYGLEDPSLVLTFDGSDGEKQITIGKSTNLGNRVYVLSPDRERIMVIKDTILDAIGTQIEDLLNSQIFTIPFFQLQKLNVQLLQPHHLKIRLARNNNEWVFESPIEVDANNALVNNAISQLSTINVHRFVPEAERLIAQEALIDPQMRVTIEGNHRNQTLIIGKRDHSDMDAVYYFAELEGSNALFTVSGDAFKALKDAQEALREKYFLKDAVAGLKNVGIQQGEHIIELQRLESGQWKMQGQDKSGSWATEAADAQVMQDLIERLKNLEAIAFVSDAPSTQDLQQFGLNDPQRIISLSGGQERTLVIGNIDPATGHMYAKLEDSPFVYLVQANVLGFTPPSRAFYKNRVMEVLPAGSEIIGLKVTDLASNKIILQHTSKTGSWSSELEGIDDKKREAVLSIVEKSRNFNVREFFNAPFSENEVQLDKETTIPWAYRIEVIIKLRGGETEQTQTREYLFTKRLSGSLQIGGSKRNNTLFKADKDWIDIMMAFHDEAHSFNTIAMERNR